MSNNPNRPYRVVIVRDRKSWRDDHMTDLRKPRCIATYSTREKADKIATTPWAMARGARVEGPGTA